MGISGLHSFVKNKDNQPSAINPAHISVFRNKVAVVDTYSWLHKSVYTCASDLFQKTETRKYVQYIVKYLNLLKAHNIKPILVFDGGKMPLKVVNEKRKEDRDAARKNAKDLIALGKMNEAYQYMVQAIDITHEMAYKVIKTARDMGIDSIVAPFEADAQLAYLEINKFADFVITEDSDLIIYGCKQIFFKLDVNSGNGEIYDRSNLEIALRQKSIKFKGFDFEKFRYAAIISGCDYLKSLPGIGLNKAWKFINMTANTDAKQFLKKLPSYLKLPIAVTDEYVEGFLMADLSFTHQPVFDPKLKKRVPLTHCLEECDNYKLFLSKFPVTECDHFQLALGNVDYKNKKFDQFDPDLMLRSSIFSQKSQASPTKEQQKSLALTHGAFNTNDYKKPKLLSIKRSITIATIDVQEPENEDENLLSFYDRLNLNSKSNTETNLKRQEEILVQPKKKVKKCPFAVKIQSEPNLSSSFFAKSIDQGAESAPIVGYSVSQIESNETILDDSNEPTPGMILHEISNNTKNISIQESLKHGTTSSAYQTNNSTTVSEKEDSVNRDDDFEEVNANMTENRFSKRTSSGSVEGEDNCLPLEILIIDDEIDRQIENNYLCKESSRIMERSNSTKQFIKSPRKSPIIQKFSEKKIAKIAKSTIKKSSQVLKGQASILSFLHKK